MKFTGTTTTERSRLMASIKGRGNKSTEKRFAALLRRCGISGWRRHYPLPGTPDFCFPKERLVVFIDGCFWHGCPHCYNPPHENVAFWKRKLHQTQKHDRYISRKLRANGWAVLRVWEHLLKKDGEKVAQRVRRALSQKRPGSSKRCPAGPISEKKS